MKKPVTYYVLAYILLVVILLVAVSNCKGQSVTIHPAMVTTQAVVLDIAYIGQSQPIGAVSIRIHYDTSLYHYDSCIRRNDFGLSGFYLSTPSFTANNQSWFGISWYATSFYDTCWTDNKPMFTAFFTPINEGCADFNFQTLWPEWCELNQINATFIPTAWQNSTVCVITTSDNSNLTTQGQKKRFKGQYDLIGREVSTGGYNVLNRKLYKRVRTQ